MPTDAQIKAVLESVTKTKDQEIAELLEVNQQLDRDCTKLAIRNAQLVIETEQLKEQFDLVLAERNEAMDEAASAKSVHETLVRNLTSMSAFAGKAMRERDEARSERDEVRRIYCEAVILHGTTHRFDANGVPEEITDAKEFARMLNWDCYKENTDGT